MQDNVVADSPPPPSLIADRYQVEKLLGRGGMAVVYQALDITNRKKVAIKQLLVNDDKDIQEKITALFEHEFYTLSQLAHPRVIEVYNYGKDDTGPYYTMELLDGGDLGELAPIPWKKACSLLIDVCSALGLIHSRRQLHRDLTPRNVRCTRDGKAKLIDFGAMTPMGPSHQVVGTPTFTAPEAVTLQALDARADLYSLGATLYCVLTRRHAYPARSFAELADRWRSRPSPPSAYVADIPKELDNLVLSLINLDMLARPSNAAEVMEKLSAISGLEVDDRLSISQAYLSKPTLVGREEQLLGIRRQTARALNGRGRTIVVEGVSGAGRSRVLDACVLEGKLAGAAVFKADASSTHLGTWDGVRAIASQLICDLPEIAVREAQPLVSILGHVVPELFNRFDEDGSMSLPPTPMNRLYPLSDEEQPSFDPSAEIWDRGYSSRPPPVKIHTGIVLQTFDNPQELRPRVLAALRDWLLRVSSHRCLMIAIDDIHRMDEPSAALVALLSREIVDKKLIIAVTMETGAPATSAAAIKLIKAVGYSVELNNLSLECVEELLGSIFGDAPHLPLLVDRIYAISKGNPGMVMHLTQHLLDKRLIRFQAGAWALPRRIDVGDLPSSLSEALKARVQKLSVDARTLAQALALSPDQSLSYEECLVLSEHRDKARLIQNLDELIAAEIFSTDGQCYSFSRSGWVPVLSGELDPEKTRAFHLRLVETFGKRNGEALALIHLFRAGEEERALDVFIERSDAMRELFAQNPETFSAFIRTVHRDWVHTLESLLSVCQRLGRPKKQAFWLENTLVNMSLLTARTTYTYLGKVIEQLYSDCGLELYHSLGDSIEAPGRLWRAFELTQQRYDSSPESERVLAPMDALRELVRVIPTVTSVAGTSFDLSLIESLPSLEPLEPLSAALAIIDRTVRSTADLIAGRSERARQGFLEVLERFSQADRASIEETYYRYARLTVMGAIATIEASLGISSALKWMDEFDADPLFQVNGWQIRMVYSLRQGDTLRAEECKKRVELLQIEKSGSLFLEETHLLPEILVYSCSDDLIKAKQTCDDLQNVADRFENWAPVLYFGRGEYQRIRGDNKSALEELEKAMALVAPGRHLMWPYLAAAYLGVLVELGRFVEAKERGEKYLALGEQENLGVVSNQIRIALALVQAKLGEYESAIGQLETAANQFKAIGITGLNLGIVYETRARVAVLMHDDEGFRTYAKRCSEQYRTGNNRALAAKYHKLMQEARQAKIQVSDDLARAVEYHQPDPEILLTLLTNALSDCEGPLGRAERVLDVLIKQSKCLGGFLYTMQKEGPVLLAQIGQQTRPVEMDTMVRNRISAEMDENMDITINSAEMTTCSYNKGYWAGQRDEKYYPLLIAHSTPQGLAITGMAVMLVDSSTQCNFPREAVAVISKLLFEAGDVAIVYAAG